MLSDLNEIIVAFVCSTTIFVHRNHRDFSWLDEKKFSLFAWKFGVMSKSS